VFARFKVPISSYLEVGTTELKIWLLSFPVSDKMKTFLFLALVREYITLNSGVNTFRM